MQGIAITRQGFTNYIEEYEVRRDPHDREYYWLTGEKMEVETNSDIDDRAIIENRISITPIQLDLTCYPALSQLRNWRITF